jgi:hypothetical protein
LCSWHHNEMLGFDCGIQSQKHAVDNDWPGVHY